MSHVFPRVLSRELPRAVSAEGGWVEDADGRRYLDGAGGAIVVNVGLLLYSSTGHVDGRDGDLLMLGPPFVLSDDELDLVIERTAAAIATIG